MQKFGKTLSRMLYSGLEFLFSQRCKADWGRSASGYYKMVQGIQHWKYDDRLNYLGLMRLERRRVRSDDLIDTFKVTKGMYDVNNQIFL